MLMGLPPKIDHIGIAVASLSDVLPVYKKLGFVTPDEAGPFEEYPEHEVRAVMLSAGEGNIELLEPTGPDTVLGRFIERNGPGLHHLCLAVEDLQAAIAEVKAAGLKLVDEVPRRGFGGRQVVFIHPKVAGGVLIELSQLPDSSTHAAEYENERGMTG